MSSPKDKAEELFTTYRFSLSIPNAPLGDLKDSIAKQCALIAVDEIISTFAIMGLGSKFYEEVKKEIEKL
jgi:hypothetical protein